MGTVRNDSNTVDYSADYATMNTRLNEIEGSLNTMITIMTDMLTAHQSLLAAHEDLLAQHTILVNRASNESLGIYTRGIIGDGGLSRAAMINALEQANQIQNVKDEMTNPTPMP